jgi:flagellar hook protein FlgE
MIESILVGMSGMQGHQRGLSIIGNNVSNMNTPGFRGSSVSFVDVFTGPAPRGQLFGQRGAGGLGAALGLVDTRPGDPQRTDREHDLSLNGPGFFIVQDETGETRYTRNGSFEFVEGKLVTRRDRLAVMTRNDAGQLVPFEIGSLQQNPPRATSKITFSGSSNLGENDNEHTIDPLVVHDSAGVKHTLKLEFHPVNKSGNLNTWKMTVFDGLIEVGSGEIQFVGNGIMEDSKLLSLRLELQNADALDVTFDFSNNIGLTFGSENSTLAVEEQDGFGVGEITARTFDQKGMLKLDYSNGQKADGPKLTFASIPDETELLQSGGALFEYRGSEPVVLREADDDLKVASGFLEGSNVDLTEEFSELILMQRGYQASSQVVTTANEMLQELFQLGSRR